MSTMRCNKILRVAVCASSPQRRSIPLTRESAVITILLLIRCVQLLYTAANDNWRVAICSNQNPIQRIRALKRVHSTAVVL